MGKVKYVLKKAIQRGENETITELHFRDEVVAGDMRGIIMREEMTFDDMLKIAGRLCAQPDDVMNKLSFADLSKVGALVGGFFEAGR
jgi:hypothetical protein